MANPNRKIVELSEKNNDMLPCPNVKVCGNYEHKDVFNCYHGRCMNCDVFLGEWQGGRGNLEFKTIDMCCICHEEGIEGVSMPKCQHFICVECFKKCFDLTDEPFFPQELHDHLDELCALGEEFPDESGNRHYEILAERHPEISEIIMTYVDGCESVHNREHLNSDDRRRLARCPLCRR